MRIRNTVLLDLQFLGITDLLVLRGDKAKHESVFTPEKGGYSHAVELQGQINNFNNGIFVDGSETESNQYPFLVRRSLLSREARRGSQYGTGSILA